MNPHIENLNAWITEHEPKGCSIWEMLFWSYLEENPINNEKMRNAFSWLYARLEHLTRKENDRFFDTLADLCLEMEKTAFYAGLRVGVRLERELTADRKSV